VAQVLADAKGRGVQTNSRVLFMLLLAASGVELARGQVAVLFAEVAELRARCPPDRRRACFGLAELSISCCVLQQQLAALARPLPACSPTAWCVAEVAPLAVPAELGTACWPCCACAGEVHLQPLTAGRCPV